MFLSFDVTVIVRDETKHRLYTVFLSQTVFLVSKRPHGKTDETKHFYLNMEMVEQ